MKFLSKFKSSPDKRELPQIIAILCSSFAGITQGTLFSWTSPSILELVSQNDTDISLEEASYFTIISPIAMVMAAPLCSQLNDTIGRKASGLLLVVPHLISWMLILLANNIWYYYISRVASGIGDAALFASVPVYVCEVSQPKVRGVWGNLVAINIYFGIFLINTIGAFYSVRTTAAICGCIPIVQFILFCFMPESPYYLLMKGMLKDARKSLVSLRWSENVDDELGMLKLDIERQESESGTWKDLFTIPSNRKALLICMFVRLAQQLSGLAAFETYTQYLFKQSGSDISEKTSAIVFSALTLVCVAACAYFVEKVGRRPLMIFSCLGTGIVLGFLSVYFCIAQYTKISFADFNWVPLAGMIMYVLISSPGIGILPTLFLGELFSTSIKVKAVGVMNVTLGMCFIVIPKLFQTLTFRFGIFAPFALFTVCCFISTLIAYLYLIETKGKTLERIQQELKERSYFHNYK